MPEHLSRPAGLHQSHGLLRLAPAQTAANTKLSITNRKSSNSWELSGLSRHLDSTWPWFLQCTPLDHQKDPILLTRCQHRRRSGWPPLSGQSNPSLLRDLGKNNTIKQCNLTKTFTFIAGGCQVVQSLIVIDVLLIHVAFEYLITHWKYSSCCWKLSSSCMWMCLNSLKYYLVM